MVRKKKINKLNNSNWVVCFCTKNERISDDNLPFSRYLRKYVIDFSPEDKRFYEVFFVVYLQTFLPVKPVKSLINDRNICVFKHD